MGLSRASLPGRSARSAGSRQGGFCASEDAEHVGLYAEFPSLNWLAPAPEVALSGIRAVVADVVRDLRASGEPVPDAIAERRYSGELRVRIPPLVHRQLALQAAAEEGVSRNRLASAKLAG